MGGASARIWASVLGVGAVMAVGAGQAAASTGSAAVTTASPPTITVGPTVTQVSQSHSVWREGNKLPTIATTPRHPVGTTFSFTLSLQSKVSFTFTQKVGRRTVTRGTWSFDIPGSQIPSVLRRAHTGFEEEACPSAATPW